MSTRKPILYKGELYSVPVTKKFGGGPKSYPVSFEEARERISSDIDSVKEQIRSLPQSSRLPNEVVMCIRMHPDFSAKSYYPETLFDADTERYGLQEIGSRIWRSKENLSKGGKKETLEAKMFFVRGTDESLDKFKKQLNKSASSLTKTFMNDVRKLVSIDLLKDEEQVVGISNDWEQGRLEAVLHPFDIDQDQSLSRFLELLTIAGVSTESINYRQYEDGITFVSLMGNRDVVSLLSGYNPLRTLHPLEFKHFVSTRAYAVNGAPKPPAFTSRPEVTVGVIDGGYVKGNPALDQYVTTEDYISGEPIPDCASHGTQVTSAVLYGALNDHQNAQQLVEPLVCVKNFRVISQTMAQDPDLYQIVDAIEKIIPANPEIKVYNLSLGPRGPIYDDHISRFTFACDLLSEQYDVLFCVAVGNDGGQMGYNRIQAPSDMVNGLAIAAYSKVDGKINRAPYSCIGPGREGNKLKPDLSAFGGCDQNPIHLLGNVPNQRALTQGTSFSSPLATSAVGKIIGYCNAELSSLTARAMIIHGICEHGEGHNTDFGHGALPSDISMITTCPEQSYTLIYCGEINSGSFVKLPIPWSDEITKGKVSFRWTSAVMTKIDPQSPDDYSTSSITTSFYPSDTKFNFKKGKKIRKLDINAQSAEMEKLLNDGWTCSFEYPATDNAKSSFKKEQDLKADLKWDSLDTRNITKKIEGVKNPMFIVHALERGKRQINAKVRYALILTLSTSSKEVDIYSKVRARYTELVPIKLELENRISASQNNSGATNNIL